MKLIRIGSSPTSDIQMTSTFVSSAHAEITLLDGGEIILEDLGSTNGTFVGDKRIRANQEITIRRGDRVRFADTELVWSRVPSLPSNTSYSRIVNIGTNYRNDVQINSGAVSRFHATLKIDKKGKAFLVDNGSKNGTKVNGIRISKDTPMQIKRGDNIILGNEDVTESIAQYLPKKSNLLPIIIGCVTVAALLAGLIYLIPNIISREPSEKAVAHVYAKYHYEVTLEGLPAEFSTLHFRFPEDGERAIEGTAFFVDELGHLVTNRHVTCPWESPQEKEDLYLIKKYVELKLHNLFGNEYIDTEYEFSKFINTPHGKEIYEYISQRFSSEHQLTQLNLLISSIRKSNIKTKGVLEDIRIGYAGRMYSKFSEYSQCTVVANSKEKEIDLAIVRLNTMTTPEDVGRYFDINKISLDKIEPMKETLCTTGFPNGLVKAFATTVTLQPTTYETKCSKQPGKYTFECQSFTAGGASGSPVYLKGTNKLVGILSQSYTTAEGGIVCVQARYLKDLYDKECK